MPVTERPQGFFEQIDKGDYDCVVTYGSGSSNHCRIIANQCCRRGMECHIISPEEASEPTFNSRMMEAALEQAGVPHKAEEFAGIGHGVGLAEGTNAEVWFDHAVSFWEEMRAADHDHS